MNATGDIVAIRRLFEQWLLPAQRGLHHSAVRAGLSRAIERVAWTMAGLAAVFAIARMGAWALDVSLRLGWDRYGWFVLAAGGVVLAASMLLVWRRCPSLMQAAERLDLGAGAYNRVATGLAFLAREQQTAFTRAAIFDGLVHLQDIKDDPPLMTPVRVPWPRLGTIAALILGLSLIAGLFPPPPEAILDAGEPAPGATASGEEPPDDHGLSAQQPKPATPPRQQEVITAVAPGGPQRLAASYRPEVKTARTAAGYSGAGGGSASRQTNQSASSGGVSPGASVSSGVPGADRKEGGARRDMRVPREPVRQARQDKAGGAAVSAGSPGAGALTPTQHDWALQEQSAARDDEDEEGDEPTEQERRSSSQRGGMQPSLKDRREAPSRELGISGDQGRPGTGRGGPTPPKKSRGTASLVLGVPVPDFVRGQLGPGPTKVTRERGRPVPMTAESVGKVTVRPRSLPETSCRRQAIPSEYAAVVRRYLVALHEAAESSETPENGGPASGQAGAE